MLFCAKKFIFVLYTPRKKKKQRAERSNEMEWKKIEHENKTMPNKLPTHSFWHSRLEDFYAIYNFAMQNKRHHEEELEMSHKWQIVCNNKFDD